VRCGGGSSHRLGLYDAVMIKDNHIASIPLDQLTDWLNQTLSKPEATSASFVEVEVDTLDQFAEVLRVRAGLIDYVLLDNMNTDLLRRSVAMRNESGSRVRLEASGGVTLETIGAIAQTGVDRISVGSLTHHAVSVDVRLDIGAEV
ncbi:MAG TPA: nicotinate-nucleotide diphosphorylase (carboxylating), partial [Phycisphaerales bacterium]|nr:nicotinate-nucleotide diphosphorylase (carboxylating) [Phycisphaerales bacterium]